MRQVAYGWGESNQLHRQRTPPFESHKNYANESHSKFPGWPAITVTRLLQQNATCKKWIAQNEIRRQKMRSRTRRGGTQKEPRLRAPQSSEGMGNMLSGWFSEFDEAALRLKMKLYKSSKKSTIRKCVLRFRKNWEMMWFFSGQGRNVVHFLLDSWCLSVSCLRYSSFQTFIVKKAFWIIHFSREFSLFENGERGKLCKWIILLNEKLLIFEMHQNILFLLSSKENYKVQKIRRLNCLENVENCRTLHKYLIKRMNLCWIDELFVLRPCSGW